MPLDTLTVALLAYAPGAAAEACDRLVARLSPGQRSRAAGMASARRRAQYAWGRLLLARLASELLPGSRAVERPPAAPALETAQGGPAWCSISHTAGLVAAAVAPSPAAIDVERIDPARRLQELAARLGHPGYLGRFAAERRPQAFYALWGAHECAVKLGGELLGGDGGFAVALGGERCALEHRILAGRPGELPAMLTIASAAPCPARIVEIAPAELL
ncbi:MAG: hypothetical protein HUK26_06285 [Duodenibacillus sp.]|nr:hypothetical protein [Duodenibacillus sp.]